MAYEFIVPDAVVSSANYTTTPVGDIDNITSGNFVDTALGGSYTSPDGVFLDADGGGPTVIRVSFPTPTAGTGNLVGVQTFFATFRRQNRAGNGTGNQTVGATGQVRDVTTGDVLVQTSTELVNNGANNIVLRFDWNATTAGISDGTNIEYVVTQTTAGSGGNPNRRSYVEVDEILWIVQTQDPLVYDPHNWGEII